MENKKSYYAIIPANVRYDKRLKLLSRLLYGEITALCNEKGYCWATNRYFAELYDVSTTTISSCISQLRDFGYLQVEIVYKDGSKEILNRYLKIFNSPIQENLDTPIQENLKENNTINNNTINNTINNSPSGQNKETIINKSNTTSKPTGKLLDTVNVKKPKQNGYIEVIQNLCSNEHVRVALSQYCNFRRSRGLTVQQWELIVKKFKQDSEGKTLEQVLQCIDQCLINGRNSLYYSNTPNKDTNSAQNTPTNDDGPAVIKRKRC